MGGGRYPVLPRLLTSLLPLPEELGAVRGVVGMGIWCCEGGVGGEVRIRVDLRRGSGGSGEGVRCLLLLLLPLLLLLLLLSLQ